MKTKNEFEGKPAQEFSPQQMCDQMVTLITQYA